MLESDVLESAYEVTRLVSRARGVDEACESILTACTTVLGADRAAVLLADGAGGMRFVASRGLSDTYRERVAGHSPWPRDARDPEPVVVPDVEADDGLRELRAAILAEGIRALVFVPLVHDDRLIGKFMLYYDAPRVVGRAELTLARLLAAQVAFAIARLRAERRADEARDELDAVLASIPDGIVVHARDGRIAYANEAMLRLLPAGREQLVGAPGATVASTMELFDEAEQPLPEEALPQRRALRGERVTRVLGIRGRGTAGPLRWVRVSSQPAETPRGARFAVTIAHDVTQLRRDAAARQFLLDAGGVLASSLDYEATLAAVARLAVPSLADWCGVYVVGEDGRAGMLAAAHVDPARVELVRRLDEAYPDDPASPTGLPNVVRTGEPEVYNGLTDDMFVATARDAEHLRLLRELRLSAVMIVPMKARGRVLGVITLASSESGQAFDAEDLRVATKLADRAAIAIDNARLYSDARASRERLAEERERLGVTLASIGDAVIATDRDGRVTLMNAVARTLTGWEPEEAVGRPLSEVFAIFSEKTGLRARDPVDKVLETGRIVGLANHTALEARDGTRRSIADSAAPIRARDGTTVGVVLVFRDVTQEQRLERELAKASKLESIGVLAGGIAHDFNNILTSISANVSLADRRVGAEHPAHDRLAAAQVACSRARELTRQLLTFSRGGAPIRTATSVGAVLLESCGFALQGSPVRAHFDVPEDTWPVDADPGQIAQVIHNIALNASQAMPDGGNLRVSVTNVELDETSWIPLPAGCYVRVALADDGPGIEPENAGRVFDPFFTTKPSGSGLGLATAYSIVKRHDGHLLVDSVPGRGTTFTLYLPVAEAIPAVEPVPEPVPPGRGRVLVMDDDDAIRDLAVECLAELGYECEAASEGGEAVERFLAAQAQGRPFDVVMLDLTVPGGMGGRETLRRLRERFPDVRAIVSSGYSNDPIMACHAEHGFAGVLQKPFVLDDIARILREILPERD